MINTLRKKLLIAFFTIIIIPNSILGILCTGYFSKILTDKVVLGSQQNNEQIAKNIELYLTSLARLSEYPNLDFELNRMLDKTYSNDDSGQVEKMDDMVKARSSLYRGILYLNNNIDSVVLYPENSNYIYWKGLEDTINFNYKLKNESWYKGILEADGKEVIIGIHKDYLLTRNGKNVVSVGRNLVNTSTKKSRGVVIINTRVDKLVTLFKDIKITPNSNILLVDENQNIITSNHNNDIGKKVNQLPQLANTNLNKLFNETKINKESYYINVGNSQYSKWKVVSIIPKSELLIEVSNVKFIIITSLIILILISIIVSAIISTGITRPILKLKNVMKTVEKGDLKVQAEVSKGEVGELAVTFNKMISETRNLINKIHIEEDKKKNAELAALQAQISPHFLYNTLNTIRWMANIQGSKGISNSLTSLIEMLTFAAKVKSDYITIGDEIGQLNHYLNILKLRYFDKFKIKFIMDEDIFEYTTLKFVLQPIVENAILHGFDDLEQNAWITIKIIKKSDKIFYDITDNGKGIEQSRIEEIFTPDFSLSNKKFNKIGIYNVNERIKLTFGYEFGITIQSEISKFTNIHIEIPAIKVEENREGNAEI